MAHIYYLAIQGTLIHQTSKISNTRDGNGKLKPRISDLQSGFHGTARCPCGGRNHYRHNQFVSVPSLRGHHLKFGILLQ